MKYIEIAVPDDFDDKAFEPADALAVATHVSKASRYSRAEIGAALLALREMVKSPQVEPHFIAAASNAQSRAYYGLTPMAHALEAELLQPPRQGVFYTRPSDGQVYAVKPKGDKFEAIVPNNRRQEITGEGWDDVDLLYEDFEAARDDVMHVLKSEPGVTIVHVFAFHGASVGGFDWYLHPTKADRALEEQRRAAVAEKDEAWTGYRFEFAAPAYLDNDAITRLIDSDLDHYCAERGTKFTIHSPVNRDIVLDSPSP